MKFDLKKINYRPHQRQDIVWRLKWLNDKNVNIFLSDDPKKITTPEEQQKWFNEYEKNTNKKFFTILYQDAPIGFIGLSKINLKTKSATLFIMLGEKKFHGKGTGTLASKFLIDYAFDKLKLNKINLEVNKQNIVAIKLYQSLGFKEDKNMSNEKEIVMFLSKM